MAEQCLQNLVAYYYDHGKKMRDEAAKLNKEFHSIKFQAIVTSGSITVAQKDQISEFLDKFVKHYITRKEAKSGVKKLASDIKSKKPDIDRWLEIRVQKDQSATRVQGGRGSAKNERHRSEQKDITEGEIQRLRERLDDYKYRLQEKDKQIYDLSQRSQGKSWEQQHNLLQQQVNKQEMLIKQQKTQLEDLSHRLSSEMNSKISANETSLENISVKNRPMTIAGEYQTLFSTEWTDAKNAIDKVWSVQEQEKLQYLCSIVLEAYQLSTFIKDKCHVYLYEPSLVWKQEITANDAGPSVGLKQVVFDYWKARGRKLDDPEKLVQEILNRVVRNQKTPPKAVGKLATVDSYVREVVNLTWNMVIQKPPMTLDISGVGERWRGEGQQELAWGSKDPTRGKVQCYVYPSLKHGDQVLVRGKVLVL